MQPRHLCSSQIQVDKHICSLSSGLLLSFTFLVSFGKKSRCIGGKDMMLCLTMFLDSKDCGVGHATENMPSLSVKFYCSHAYCHATQKKFCSIVLREV